MHAAPPGARHSAVRIALLTAACVATLWLATLGLVLLAGLPRAPRRADAILVLGAAQYNGHPSPVLKARLDHGIALYRAGWAPRLLLTGGVGRHDTLSEAEVGRRYARAAGVPEGAILVERRGVTSAQSVVDAAALLRALGLRRVLLVSDPFHMLRAELLALRAGLLPYAAATPTSRIEAAPGIRWRYVLRESLLFPATALLGGK